MGKGREWALVIGGIVIVASLLTLIASAYFSAERNYVSSREQPAGTPPPTHGAPPPPPSWITSDDYPAEALRNNWQGTVAIEWTIDTSGRAIDCKVTKSSGHAVLDEASCAAIIRRARYAPALNANGKPVASKDKRRIVWALPD